MQEEEIKTLEEVKIGYTTRFKCSHRNHYTPLHYITASFFFLAKIKLKYKSTTRSKQLLAVQSN